MGDNKSLNRKEKIKELELVLEAKKNINNLLLTIMSIFYALNGVLLSITITASSKPYVLFIPLFGITSMILFSFIVGRMRSTNDNCDRGAWDIEKLLGFEVITNYKTDKYDYYPKWLHNKKMHLTIMFFNLIIMIIWLSFVFYLLLT
jgi:hypothetical protein